MAWYRLKLIWIFSLIFFTIQANNREINKKPEERILADTLNLEQCIKMAIMNSPEIVISKGNVHRSELEVSDARAGFLPDVNLSGGYYLNDSYDDFEWNQNHYDLSISASVRPFSSGRTYLDFKRTGENLTSAKEGFRMEKMDLIMEVMSRYYNLLKASKLLDLRKQALEQKKKQLEFSKTQFELGIVPRADTLKARAALEGARVNLHKSQGEIQVRIAELNESMGIDMDLHLNIRAVKLSEIEVPEFDSILSISYSERPDINQQEASIAAKRYSLTLARINRFPVVTLTGGYQINADPFAFGGLPVNRNNWVGNTSWGVELGVSLPIFDGGVKSRAITRAGIDLNNSRLQYENLKRRVKLEVKSAHIDVTNAAQEIELTEKQVISAEESYKAALGRYQNGVAPITEVLDAEVIYTQSKVNQINAIYDFLEAKALLRKAAGVLYRKEEQWK